MVYMPSGLPIYSKCFSGFCKANATDDILLSGFLSALESFPSMVGGEALKAIEMGNTSFVFRKTTPSGISVAMGVSKGADLDEAQDVFNQIQILLEEKYNHSNWDVISPGDYEAFKQLVIFASRKRDYKYYLKEIYEDIKNGKLNALDFQQQILSDYLY